MERQPTRVTKTYNNPDGQIEDTDQEVREWASLDSYEATTNAKGHVQFHVKLYKQPGAEPEAEVARHLDILRAACREKGFTIAGDS